jgi:hypothetical protein
MSGLFVGAVLGTVFLYSSTSDVHASLLTIVLRVLATVVLAGVAGMWLLGLKAAQSGGALPATPHPADGLFSRRYGLVIAAEAALLLGGLAPLRGLGLPEQATVAWLTFVAGAHFIVLVPRWRTRVPLAPGMILVAIGVAGLALAATRAPAWASVTIGVLFGMTVLIGSAACSWSTLTSIWRTARP